MRPAIRISSNHILNKKVLGKENAYMLYLFVGAVVALIVWLICCALGFEEGAWRPSLLCGAIAFYFVFICFCPMGNAESWKSWETVEQNEYELIVQNKLYCTVSGNGETINVLCREDNGKIVAKSFYAKNVSFCSGDSASIEVCVERANPTEFEMLWYVLFPSSRLSATITLPSDIVDNESETAKFCINCGVEVSDDWKFCSGCGTRIE